MDLEENRNLQRSYLYINERKFLAGQQYKDDLNTEAKNRARRNIVDERLPNLSHRIQALVDDIALLEAGGFLDSEYHPDGWEQLLNVEPRLHLKRDSDFVDPHTWMPHTRLDDEVRLGYTIGQTLRSLTFLSNTHTDYDELGWGFILGLFGEPRSNFGEEYSRIFRFFEYVYSKMDKKKERSLEINDIIEIESIEEDLSLNSFNSEPDLSSYSGMADRLERATMAVKKYKQAYSDPYLHETNDPDLEYLKLLENILVHREEVVSAIELINRVRNSIKLINNSQSGQLFAKEVFRVVWNTESRLVERDNIKKECNTSKKQVTEIMNNFGSDPSSKKWMNKPPLVKKEGSKRVGGKWSLTNLGYVVGYAMFEDNGAEFVYRAFGQVITDQHDRHEIHNRISDAILEI